MEVTPATEREPKWKALQRLENEGRLELFQKLKLFYKTPKGGTLRRDEAFYAALAKFPPLES